MKNTIAIIDCETTGLDPFRDEIIDLAAILVDKDTLEVVDTFESKIKPQRVPSFFDPVAIQLNGYNKEEWEDAPELEEAMVDFCRYVQDSMMAAYNVSFDYGFINSAFKYTGIKDPMDHHRIDIFTLAWAILSPEKIDSWKLKDVAAFLGVTPEIEPHRALGGAWCAHQVLKKLRDL